MSIKDFSIKFLDDLSTRNVIDFYEDKKLSR